MAHRRIYRSYAWMIIPCLLLSSSAFAQEADNAEGAGQQALNEAVQIKLTAKDMADLGKVIQLCDKALEDGLSEDSEAFCKQLLSATLVQRATVVAEAILSQPPTNPQWGRMRKLALDDLENAVELEDNQPEAWLQIGRLQALPGGDHDKAIEAIDHAIELGEGNRSVLGKAYLYRALATTDDEKRLADLNRSLEEAPNNVQALQARGALLADMEKYEESLEDLREAAKAEPDDPKALHLLALVLQEMGRTDDAAKLLEQAAELAKNGLPFRAEQARILAADEQYEAALKVIDNALEDDPGNIGLLLLRASVNQERDEPELAIDDVDRVLRMAPELEIALRLKAGLLAGEEEYGEALEILEKILDLQEKQAEPDIELLLQMALLHAANDAPDKALPLFKQVLKKHPDNVMVLRAQADMYLNIGDHKKAIRDYEKALSLEPEDSGILNNLAWVLATSPDDSLRDGDRAIELATKGCEITEYKEAHILSTLGAAYAETGDFETAKKWAAKSVEMAKEDETITPKMLESLKSELASYQEEKPWREELPPDYEETTDDESEDDSE